MIRIAEESDVPQILDIYAPYILQTTYTCEYDVPSEAAFLQRFRTITTRFPWLVWEEDGLILGYAYGSAPFERAAYRWCSESSVYLRPEARGRGIGRQLYTALEAILARQGFRLNYAIITSENQTSLTFHQKMGYAFTAKFPGCSYKFGRWLSVTWMQKELNFVYCPRHFPEDWCSIRQDEQKFSDILDNLSLF